MPIKKLQRPKSWLSKTSLIGCLTTKRKAVYGKAFGKIVIRRRSAGRYNKIHYLNNKKLIWNLPGVIVGFERNRTVKSYLSLVCYPNGIFAYNVACAGQTIGDSVLVGWNVPSVIGNSLPLQNIPLNIKINSIESAPGSGSSVVRAPGNWAMILSKTDKIAMVIFRGGRTKEFHLDCLATIGRVANIQWNKYKLKKAGQSRNLGRRPWVRGVAQNPIDHPHGGGKGKKSKNAVPEGPWGRLGARKKKIKSWVKKHAGKSN